MTRTVLLSGEMDPAELQFALGNADLTRLRRGAYAAPVEGTGPQADTERAIALISAVHRQLQAPHVFCYASAALVWGLPLWTVPQRVHVIQRAMPGRPPVQDIVRHREEIAESDIVERDGYRVTSLARTVADCARMLPGRDGLSVADAALQRHVTRSNLLAAVRPGQRGARRAREVLKYADPGAESAGESVTRYVFLRAGLPQPETQIKVVTRLGTYRADMGWRKQRVLVEFDGFIKYSRLANGDPSRVVFKEKRRQDAIDEENWRVLRVVMADLREPDHLVARVQRFARGALSLEPRPNL